LEVIAFDEIVRELTARYQQRVKLVKLHCDSSEFPILLTSRTLHLIDGIVDEFHEINDGRYNSQSIPPVARVAGVERFTIGVLTDCLRQAGFSVRSQRAGHSPLGHFVATRVGTPPAGRPEPSTCSPR
jgi:hypothetical protein